MPKMLSGGRYAQIDPEADPPHRSRKNTRKWCKGRNGIPHDGEWQVWGDTWAKCSFEWQRLICKNCGKHVKYRKIVKP